MVRSISHERSEAIEGDGVQLKKLPLKQFAPKGGVTNVGVLGVTQMAGSMEIDGGETKRFGMSPISIWQPIITCQMPYHAIPTDTKTTYCTHLYMVHVSGTYRAVNVKPNSFGTESGFWRISQRSSNVNFVSKVIEDLFRIIFIYFQSLALLLYLDSEALIRLLKTVVTYQCICEGSAICSFYQEAIQFWILQRP